MVVLVVFIVELGEFVCKMSLNCLNLLKHLRILAVNNNVKYIIRQSTISCTWTGRETLERTNFLHSPKIYIFQERYVHPGRARCRDSTKTCPTENKDVSQPQETQKLSLFQKFKAMYRDYWYVLVPVHVVTSTIFYGSFYYMARTGVDIAALAEWAHFGEETVEKIRKSGNSLAGHLAIAYLLYKVITPLRYTVTLGGTTVSINYLKKWGLIKPMPKRDELKRMFDEKKVYLRKKRDSLRERKELVKKSVMSNLPSKKRMKSTSDLVKRMLTRKKNLRRP